ncbi:isoamyl alcohol oxidase [Ceratobasidium sp. AG-Ba]|nr:isoamyl alcohol oxidase [Ceratobasidium sp. AG-Ba]
MIRRSRVDDDVALDPFKIVLPQLPRTCSLEARSEKTNLSIQLVLLDWLTNGSPGSVKELSLPVHNEFGWNHHGWHLLSTIPLDQGYVNPFLAPLRTLRLEYFFFHWDSAAYRGLAHLEISHLPSECSPTLKQMADILAASPELRTLKLRGVDIITGHDNVSSFSPITLSKVEVLSVQSAHRNPLVTLFPIVASISSELSLKVSSKALREDPEASISFSSAQA